MNSSKPCNPSGGAAAPGAKAQAAQTAGVLFPLTARSTDMGNTMGIDMGNTFSAPPAVGAWVSKLAKRLHTSSQTLPIRPLGACDEVCSRSREMFISLRRGRKCYLCLCPECYPCLCPLPTPALSPRRRGKHSPRQRSGDCNRNVRIFQRRASALPLLGERVGVRGNEANSNPRRTTIPGTVKLRESPGRAGGFPI